MAISAVRLDPRVADVRCSETELEIVLRDGRRFAAPLSWYPRLASATLAQRAHWEPAAAGHGVHWPDIDEDLSVEGIMGGNRAPGA
jgi:hypothetical protein